MTNFLSMFDKLDDIVYEPVRLVCDALRQPLKNIDAKNARLDKELDAKIARDAEAFAVEMDSKRRTEEIKNEILLRKGMEEINSMRENDQLERNKKIIEAYEEYKEHFAKLSVTITKSIGQMQLDLREKAQDLCLSKTREYKALQDEAMDQMLVRMDQAMKFPEGPARDMLLKRIDALNESIVKRAEEFISFLGKDMEQLSQHFNAIADQTMANAERILSPMAGNEVAGILRKQPDAIGSR